MFEFDNDSVNVRDGGRSNKVSNTCMGSLFKNMTVIHFYILQLYKKHSKIFFTVTIVYKNQGRHIKNKLMTLFKDHIAAPTYI